MKNPHISKTSKQFSALLQTTNVVLWVV